MNNKTILQEAFKQFELLEEETFHLDNSEESVEDAKEFMDASDALDMLDVIDPEAETEEEVEDSYTDKVILDCNVCHSKIYKDPSEIIISDDKECVNKDEECPFCYSMDGYKIIGQVKPFVEDDFDITVEPKEEETSEEGDAEVTDEEEKETEVVDESLENIDVETEHDKIHIEAEEKVESDEEMIAPLEPEVEDEIEDNQEEEEEIEEEPSEGEEEIDYDIDDFDEETFDDLGESYLRNVYENVNSFKTSKVTEKGNKWIVEGRITFNSGNTKPTKFIFEAFSANKKGKLNFIGENAQISRGKKSFKLSGVLDNKKFISESLNYNYRQKDATGKSVRVYGTVKR